MQVAVATLGHGGGVPFYTDQPTGNTNFAVFPDVSEGDVPKLKQEEKVDYLLQNKEFWLVDCGPETAIRLCKTKVESGGLHSPVHNLQGILLTHCHADHSLGIPSIAWYSYFIAKRSAEDNMRRPLLVAASDVLSMLKSQCVELTRFSTQQKNERDSHLLKEFGEPGLEWFFDVHAVEMRDTMPAFGKAFFGQSSADLVSGLTAFLQSVDHNIERMPGTAITLARSEGGLIVFSGDTARPLNLAYSNDSLKAVYHDVQFYNEGDGFEVHCPFGALNRRVPKEYKHKVLLSHCIPSEYAETQTNFGWACKDRVDFYSL